MSQLLGCLLLIVVYLQNIQISIIVNDLADQKSESGGGYPYYVMWPLTYILVINY